MTNEREKDKEKELAHNETGETEEAEVQVGEEGVDEKQLEDEQPSLPSDADPFLLHMLRCEDLLERLGPLLELDAGSNQRVRDAFTTINEGDYGAALKALDEARKEEEPNPLIPLLSAIALLRQGDAWQAASQCDAALALNALDLNAWLCKATVEAAEHRFVDACERLSKAIELAPNDVGVLVSQGACFIRLGRFDEAIRVLYRAQKIDHSNIRAWINKGIAYAYTHRLKDALNCFSEALLLDPDNTDARTAKEEMLRRLTH
ncbi:MAG: tetratricopeptide repeat protein [Euryarchaeota archaeon]|nr:tetratricopeptide repeat protein [Euryarchaeota archaeon]